jgi:hypothetical protein
MRGHAAIVSRKLGLPCVVGTGDAASDGEAASAAPPPVPPGGGAGGPAS